MWEGLKGYDTESSSKIFLVSNYLSNKNFTTWTNSDLSNIDSKQRKSRSPGEVLAFRDSSENSKTSSFLEFKEKVETGLNVENFCSGDFTYKERRNKITDKNLNTFFPYSLNEF